MSGLNTSQMIKDLMRDEDEVLHAYQDHLGFWTIGVGILIDKRKGGGITKEESDYLLTNRLSTKMAEMDKGMPWWRQHPESVQRALLNMAYQMGVAGLLEFKTTLGLIQAKKYNEAADNALRSLWARQTPDRAKRVAALIRSAK
jgi:lysozyme